jgi:hypothetical protein
MTAPENTDSPAEPLARAQAAYAAGDFARVRVEVADAVGAADPEIAQQARELRARVAIDAWVWAVLGAAFVLFCGIVVVYAR